MPRRRYYPGPGVRFGNRVVLRMTSHGKDGESRVEVRCDCGALDRVSVSRLTRRQMDRCTSCAAKKRTEEKMATERINISGKLWERLYMYCARRELATGRRVTMGNAVEQILNDWLDAHDAPKGENNA